MKILVLLKLLHPKKATEHNEFWPLIVLCHKKKGEHTPSPQSTSNDKKQPCKQHLKLRISRWDTVSLLRTTIPTQRLVFFCQLLTERKEEVVRIRWFQKHFKNISVLLKFLSPWDNTERNWDLTFDKVYINAIGVTTHRPTSYDYKCMAQKKTLTRNCSSWKDESRKERC